MAAGSAGSTDVSEQELASFVMQHVAALEAEVRYGDGGLLSNEALLDKALSHKAGWREPYGDLQLFAKAIGGHAVLLVCTRDFSQAILEDSGCTAQFDKFRSSETSPCEFSFTETTVCEVKQ